MASIASSSSLLFTFPNSNLPPPSLSPPPRLSLSSSHSSSLASTLSISTSFFAFTTNSRRPSLSSFTVKATAAEKKKVLVVNTNSGGHAVIGFYFAKELLGSGHEVTIMTVGEESSDKMKKPPFNRFSEIVSAGLGHREACGRLGQEFWCKAIFVYQQCLESISQLMSLLMLKGMLLKQMLVMLVWRNTSHEIFGSWAIFRPQYMIGSGNNKDCEEWFFDRIVRGRPVPIPGSGMQLTNIAHVRDLSSMLTLAVEIVHYDPKAVGIDAKKAFPFRNMHFYAEPRAAKDILGWCGTTNLPEDLKERFDEYVKIGRDKKPMKFEMDDKILESVKVPVAV
ncbi:hypothetical protein F0562_002555 [Nyssa sinensis]|uniref:NAD-dependent epimerase/dehydratase domain-containing protein n=1 Tax=Nyssa sinensis TaxID=561372 RepID=A0A5J5CB43_9ASTE|nr:hypothetical protein F0562_002555 [Nyssa sinensis]